MRLLHGFSVNASNGWFRATVVSFGIGTLVVLSLNTGLLGQDDPRPDQYSQLNPAQALNRDVSFRQPAEVLPGDATTYVDLCVKKTVNWFDGIELEHRSYNGGLVGPTIRIKPGQELIVNLRNQLRPEPESSHESNQPHGFNVTNLHTHGLHVSPESPADDVFREVRPGQSFRYQFQIPPDHPPGTFWYHAHKHGSTALQLASGMAGALIVEGGLDEIPEIRQADEKVLVLQQFTYRPIAGQPAVVDPDLIYKETGELVEAINGVVTPTIIMRPGEVQRWRIIHAGTVEAIQLDLAGVNFYEIAVDGLATGKRALRDSLLLYPGYRSDVLVQAPDQEIEILGTSEIKNAELAILQETTERRCLLKLVVKGPPKPMRLPTKEQLKRHAAFTEQDVPTEDEIAKTRELIFNQTRDGKFLVDGEEFDPDVVRQMIDLGTAEQWEIRSEAGVHPFHIHVNPFASRRSGSNQDWVWRDTIVVTKSRPVTLRTRYQRFTGKTVLHCHNLVHEDKGMMQAIMIRDPSIESEIPANPVSEDGLVDSETASLVSADRLHQTKPALSVVAPRWSARKSNGESIDSESLAGRTVLLVLHRGMHCLHCAQQLSVLNQNHRKFEDAGIQVVAISQFLPQDTEALKVIESMRFPVLIDPDLKCFQKFDCIANDGVPQHGLFLIDPNNRIQIADRTDVAITDEAELIKRFIDLNNLLGD